MPASRRHECIQTLEPFGYEFPDVGVKSASDDEFTRTLAAFAYAGIGFIRDQELMEPDINCVRSTTPVVGHESRHYRSEPSLYRSGTTAGTLAIPQTPTRPCLTVR